MKYIFSDDRSSGSRSTKWHLSGKCPAIVGHAKAVADDEIARLGIDPTEKGLCGQCRRRREAVAVTPANDFDRPYIIDI